jgi:hypothetical protein
MFTMRFLSLILFTLTAACTGLSVSAETPKVSEISYMLGDTSVKLQVKQYGSGPTFIALHENESTSVRAANQVVPAHGGTMVVLQHSGHRNVTFTLHGESHSFDPNRIFSDTGIRATLGFPVSEAAFNVVSDFARFVTNQIGDGPIVALHNNTAGNYSVSSYVAGGSFSADARSVYVASGTDPDDFYFVTKKQTFKQLQKSGYSVVLQAARPADDGSLSVYSARRGIPYVNIEAEHGKVSLQQKMLIAFYELTQ